MSREAGYSYLSVLIVVFALALSAQATWIPSSTETARERERELLFRGAQYRRAIESYWSFQGLKEYPAQLADLLNDPRGDDIRHLRRLFEDPVCRAPWRLVQGGTGEILGVAPACDDVPFKRAGFRAENGAFSEARTYQDWEFTFIAPEEQQ